MEISMDISGNFHGYNWDYGNFTPNFWKWIVYSEFQKSNNFYGSSRKFPEIIETLSKYIWNEMVLDYLEALANGHTEGGGEI